MNYFKLLVSVLLLGFIASCVPPSGPSSPGVNISDKDDPYYDERKRRDDDRKDVLERSRTRRSGNICEEEDRNHECKDLCKEIYGRVGDKKDCEELTVAQIDALFTLYELLESPDEDDLVDVEAEDFDVYLNVSIASLEDLIDDEWNSRESKEFLYWLINNEDAATVFEKEDDDYDTLTALLKNINSFSTAEIWEPFTTKIEDDKLMEVAIDSGNEMVVEWFMDYIEDKSDDCRREMVSLGCFEVYCKIGDGIDEDFMEEWLSYGDFESYIDDIIDEGVNSNDATVAGGDSSNDNPAGGGTSWDYGDGDGKFEDIGDISDDWVADLCTDLT